MRIKTCLIIPTLVQGGAEKQLALLATNLDPEKFDVHVIVLTHSGPYESILSAANVPMHFIGKRGKFDPFAFGRLKRKLRELKPDVVHTWLFAANCYGRAAAFSCGVPVVIGGERCVDPWKAWWQISLDRYLAKKTDTIATNTSAVSQFYSKHRIDEEKFTVIPNAIDTAAVTPLTKRELCERLQIPFRSKIVGAVGRLWEQKGYPDLIWSGELLHVAYQDVWFVIVGEGPDLAKLQTYRDKSGAKDAVRFAGHRKDATELMSAFDVLWNGSLYEGQSNTILEAMSLGVPVIASDIPGNRDLVAQEETGYLYELGDVETVAKITNALLLDEQKRLQISAAAKQKARDEFSLKKMVLAHQNLYERLCLEKGRSN